MKSLLICSALFFSSTSIAQNDSLILENSFEKEVESVIETLFLGMKEGDSSLVSSTFHDDIRMMSSFTNQAGASKIHKGTRHEFVTAVGTPHVEVWNERVSNLVIQVDDNLAQAWMDYSFYVDENFSHCGVNAMQLIKTDSGWKILQITDTRRSSKCAE